jgi:hypothetical protein
VTERLFVDGGHAWVTHSGHCNPSTHSQISLLLQQSSQILGIKPCMPSLPENQVDVLFMHKHAACRMVFWSWLSAASNQWHSRAQSERNVDPPCSKPGSAARHDFQLAGLLSMFFRTFCVTCMNNLRQWLLPNSIGDVCLQYFPSSPLIIPSTISLPGLPIGLCSHLPPLLGTEA